MLYNKILSLNHFKSLIKIERIIKMTKTCKCETVTSTPNHKGTCKCNKNTGCLEKNRYFSAVCDVIERMGKVGEEMVEISNFRYFNEKFVDNPATALLLAFDSENIRWKVDPSEILEGVTYNPETREYIKKTILTRDGHVPNEKQKEKILAGIYEYIILEEYVQVFETNLITGSTLIPEAINRWRKRTE